jgi:hypothetical protein
MIRASAVDKPLPDPEMNAGTVVKAFGHVNRIVELGIVRQEWTIETTQRKVFPRTKSRSHDTSAASAQRSGGES